MALKTYEELVWQLSRLPGGAEAAIPDFFGHLLQSPPTADNKSETWLLQADARITLIEQTLHVYTSDQHTQIATLPEELMAAAQQARLSPLLLGLLALATGDVDGSKQLKAVLPKVDGAAKDLMLMTVCRLCG